MAATNFKTENNTFRKLIGNGLSYRIPGSSAITVGPTRNGTTCGWTCWAPCNPTASRPTIWAIWSSSLPTIRPLRSSTANSA